MMDNPLNDGDIYLGIVKYIQLHVSGFPKLHMFGGPSEKNVSLH
jgi:hypothetical protein